MWMNSQREGQPKGTATLEALYDYGYVDRTTNTVINKSVVVLEEYIAKVYQTHLDDSEDSPYTLYTDDDPLNGARIALTEGMSLPDVYIKYFAAPEEVAELTGAIVEVPAEAHEEPEPWVSLDEEVALWAAFAWSHLPATIMDSRACDVYDIFTRIPEANDYTMKWRPTDDLTLEVRPHPTQSGVTEVRLLHDSATVMPVDTTQWQLRFTNTHERRMHNALVDNPTMRLSEASRAALRDEKGSLSPHDEEITCAAYAMVGWAWLNNTNHGLWDAMVREGFISADLQLTGEKLNTMVTMYVEVLDDEYYKITWGDHWFTMKKVEFHSARNQVGQRWRFVHLLGGAPPWMDISVLWKKSMDEDEEDDPEDDKEEPREVEYQVKVWTTVSQSVRYTMNVVVEVTGDAEDQGNLELAREAAELKYDNYGPDDEYWGDTDGPDDIDWGDADVRED